MNDQENFSEREKNRVEAGTLYLVATPIGNLGDLSDRAKKILAGVDFVAAEDTRNTGKLLAYYHISRPMISYYEHNKRERGRQIAARLSAGESCALVTDAGMPAISDPGEDLVRLCAERNIPVTVVPGPCAAVTALALSALPTVRFAFEGFLSAAKRERTDRLEALRGEERTMVFYEAPHKLRATLADMYAVLGNRSIALCRELTKLNEEIQRTDLSAAIEYYTLHEPRGEYVLVVSGAQKSEENAFWTDMTVAEHVEHYLSLGLPKMDAIKTAARDRGVPKNTVYKALL